MILYPAIDLMNGQCVRLHKGDFAQATIYSADPLAMADSFEKAGAQWLHLVDLDGAKDSSKRQINLIENIISGTKLFVQTGGGVRSMEDAKTLLDAGVQRVVVGSLAVKKPEEVQKMLQHCGPEKICLAMDVIPDLEGVLRVAVSGWQEETNILLADLIRQFQEYGLQYVLCTDVSRDGTLQGANMDLYKTLHDQFPGLNILASGGIKGLDDLAALKAANAHGAVIGKALYEGVFSLKQAREFVAAC